MATALLSLVLCIWISSFQSVLCRSRDATTAAPSATAVGVLTFPDKPLPNLISPNSVEIPDFALLKPKHQKRQAVADTDGSSNALFGGDSVPKLLNIQAECFNPQFIKVSLDFDRDFQGIIYTKGHFADATCAFAKEDYPAKSYNFTVPTEACGSLDNHAETNASITEATLIIQNDPLFQDASDVARRIRCAWSDRFDKIISSRGFRVGSLAENTMDYSADAVSVWMDLRMGKDPFQGTPVTNGVVRLGSDMTIVVYIKSKIEKGLDVVIRDCVANDAKKHQQIQLTDENGCVVQKKLMTPFTITDRVGQSGASRIAYAMLKSFKFPDSLDVNIICNVAMCKGDCGISCEKDKAGAKPGAPKPAPVAKVDSMVPRVKRDVEQNTTANVTDPDDDVIDIIPFKPANVVPVDTHPSGTLPPPRSDLAGMDNPLIGKTVFLKEREPTEVVLERGIRVLSDNDITEVLVGNQNRSFDVLATMVKNTDYICLTRTGFGIGLGILLLIILILSIICVFLCCAACAKRKQKETKIVEDSTINIYNSTDQLTRSKMETGSASLPLSGPTSILRGSLPNIHSYATSNVGSTYGYLPRVSRDPNMKASAMTLPGLGIQTNPHVRHSTQSLNAMHHIPPTDNMFLPIVLPEALREENADDTEKARSLRSIAVPLRPHSVDILNGRDATADEATRSLRSFTVRSQHGAQQPEDNADEEKTRSLRSFTVQSLHNAPLRLEPVEFDDVERSLRSYSVRSNNSLGKATTNNGENPRSLRSFTVRSRNSDHSADTETSDVGENPRSEGTIRSGSQVSLVRGGQHSNEENARSLRSVSVYRN
ncbi:uncharacterized protein LOC129599340 [Paramacrobiotus metropolitanus]|uniref:uncharacterized protein LOC129599340 n=1 Tax=Paramacrobiotus metropolitanus TaxID=2943436 RepID=UPI0024460AD9|nr:uncharacterized protein LOC129599340 [Paramacrobiotus metropolitanus]